MIINKFIYFYYILQKSFNDLLLVSYFNRIVLGKYSDNIDDHYEFKKGFTF